MKSNQLRSLIQELIKEVVSAEPLVKPKEKEKEKTTPAEPKKPYVNPNNVPKRPPKASKQVEENKEEVLFNKIMDKYKKLQNENILNEYSNKIINQLVNKFKQEKPNLEIEIIKMYIDRFSQIKNNPKISKKDITKYNWEELETIINSYPSKKYNPNFK